MATILVMAMLFSSIVVFNEMTNVKLVEDAKALTPGVPQANEANVFGNATTSLKYDTQYTAINIDTSTWNDTAGTTKYYLYYPTYVTSTGAGLPASEFTWAGPYTAGGNQVYVDPTGSTDPLSFGSSITFNRSGMFIFDNNSVHAGNDPSTYAGYIWVNTSTDYLISPSSTSFAFGSTGTFTATVSGLGAGEDGYMLGLIRPDGTTARNLHYDAGSTASWGIEGNFTMAGEYNVTAYRDCDLWNAEYRYDDENGNVYNTSYGSSYTGDFPSTPGANAQYYTYANVGPWDPPERNSSSCIITVNKAEPTMVVTNTTTAYWGFDLNMEINVTAPNKTGITGGTISLRKVDGSQVISSGTYGDVVFTQVGNGNYTIVIPRYVAGSSNWTNIGNASYYLTFKKDVNGDNTEEWNVSERFTIKSTTPPVRLTILDDGDITTGTTIDNKVNVPNFNTATCTPGVTSIQFRIYGTSVSDAQGRAYYGDNPGVGYGEDRYNITVAGDILYPISDSTLQYDATNNKWFANVTPTKPGGTITITINWLGSNNGTDSEVINIINGSTVTANYEEFTYGDEIDITATVKNLWDTLQQSAMVYLVWRGGAFINGTNGTGGVGNGQEGEYTFKLLQSNQGTSAPQNITIAARSPGSNHWGYDSIKMNKRHNMVVNCTPASAYAGDAAYYNIDILVNGVAPKTYSDINIKLYDSKGALVSGDDAWSDSGKYDINNALIILSGGVYQLYAYNNTDDSEGHNATLTVTRYSVATSPSILAWLIDTETNVTFEVTPAGNGTLIVENVSATPNASFVGQSQTVSIEDGIGTLTGVNATDLGNITFDYIPESGEQRPADGLLKITTATATPDPATIYINEPATVVITVTHPGTGAPLEGVRVDIDYGKNVSDSMLTQIPQYQTTDADGKATFSGLLADGGGNVTIYIKRGTDPDNPFIIKTASRKTLKVTADPSVDEVDDTFTVLVKDTAGNLLTGVTVSILFNTKTYTTTTGSVVIDEIPSVPESLTYTITASAEGYTDDDTTILIVNIAQIYMTAPSTATKGEAFTIKVGADGVGDGIVVTLTKPGKTYTAVSVDSVVSFTVDELGTYTITAEKDGCASPKTSPKIEIVEKKTPGFELLTLIIAIGVAFILLRRRQKN